MTTLIYRGYAHAGMHSLTPHARTELIYRGARHEGLAPSTPLVQRDVFLIYRGVRHFGAPAFSSGDRNDRAIAKDRNMSAAPLRNIAAQH